ncbi:MAG: MBL fold metallo-hydrolase [Chloroflexi bacterium]|nr:MAG: MBL fold metallo-hydrolase [Chloroflexota bacterium]
MGTRHEQALRHRAHRLRQPAAPRENERRVVSPVDRRASRGSNDGGGEMTRVAASPTATLRGLDLAPGTIALWWLGQAGFAVRAGGLVLLLDPFLTPMAERVSAPAFDPEEAVDVDVVICSHEHYDHLDLASLPTIARVSPGARFVVPRPLVDAVAAAGVPRARLIGAQPDERIRVDGVTLHPVPARHGVGMADAYTFGRELSNGLYRYLGYVLDDGVARIYHAGDTIVYDGQAERLRALGADVALLPINGRDHFREAAGVVGNMDHREADTFPQNLGFPAHLVDVVRRDHPSLTILIPSRDRPVLYAKASRGA